MQRNQISNQFQSSYNYKTPTGPEPLPEAQNLPQVPYYDKLQQQQMGSQHKMQGTQLLTPYETQSVPAMAQNKQP